MKFSIETRFLRLELELGFPRLQPKKYEILPRWRCFRVHDSLMHHISSRLKQAAPHDVRTE